MDIQRLRNLTTARLHTEVSHIYQDIEYLTGEKGVMTHMLPNAARALKPYLRAKIQDVKFWDDMYDTAHVGEIEVPPMNEAERAEFWKRYDALPSPLQRRGSADVRV